SFVTCFALLSSTLFPYTTLFRSLPARALRERLTVRTREKTLVGIAWPFVMPSDQPHHPRRSALDLRLRGAAVRVVEVQGEGRLADRKSTRLNSSHLGISYADFCL